ncbi:hypothetical protein AAMO2058_000224100 [Amorphochlora amoebiformis]
MEFLGALFASSAWAGVDDPDGGTTSSSSTRIVKSEVNQAIIPNHSSNSQLPESTNLVKSKILILGSPILHAEESKYSLDNDGDIVVCRRRRKRKRSQDDNGKSPNEQKTVVEGERMGGVRGEGEIRRGDDEQGEVLVPECVRNKSIVISHLRATSLPAVGLQLWTGSLILSDYLIANPSLLQNAKILDLGVGSGLTTIVAKALGAQCIIATDYHDEILANLQKNIEANSSLFEKDEKNKHSTSQTPERDPPPKINPVLVRKLDWLRIPKFLEGEGEERKKEGDLVGEKIKIRPTGDTRQREGIYGEVREEEMKGLQLVLAADVVYDPRLTDALAHLLDRVVTTGVVAIVSAEKRVYFSENTLKQEVYEWPRFIDLVKLGGLKVETVNVASLPQHIPYQRNRFLEIVRITRPHRVGPPPL